MISPSISRRCSRACRSRRNATLCRRSSTDHSARSVRIRFQHFSRISLSYHSLTHRNVLQIKLYCYHPTKKRMVDSYLRINKDCSLADALSIAHQVRLPRPFIRFDAPAFRLIEERKILHSTDSPSGWRRPRRAVPAGQVRRHQRVPNLLVRGRRRPIHRGGRRRRQEQPAVRSADGDTHG